MWRKGNSWWECKLVEPGLGRSPWGNGTPLQYSCLGNPMDRGAWWATVQGVTESWTRLRTHTEPPWRTTGRFFRKLKIELPHDPAIPLLGKHPDKILIKKYTCTHMFIATLFTIVKTCKQPTCPSTDEWTKKM